MGEALVSLATHIDKIDIEIGQEDLKPNQNLIAKRYAEQNGYTDVYNAIIENRNNPSIDENDTSYLNPSKVKPERNDKPRISLDDDPASYEGPFSSAPTPD